MLATAIQGGKPPDLASIAQPGLLADFANQGALKPIGFARATQRGTTRLTGSSSEPSRASSTVSSSRRRTSRPSGTRRPHSGPQGSGRLTTWPALLAAARTRGVRHPGLLDRRSGRVDAHRPVREHLLASGRAGQVRPATAHTIPWTHTSVKAALRTMAAIFSDTGNMYGGTSGALQTDFDRLSTTSSASRQRQPWFWKVTSSPASRRRRRRRARTTTSSRSRRSAARRRRSSAAGTSSSCSRTALRARRSSSTWRHRPRRRSRRSTRRATRPRTRTSQRAPIPTRSRG